MGDLHNPSKTGAKLQGQAVAALEPKEMQDYLLNHPLSRGGRLWCDRVLEGCDKGERTALRLYAEAMKWVGAQVNIGAVFLQQLGVRDEAQLGSLVEQGKRLERLGQDVSHDRLFEDSLEALRLCLNAHPEWKGKALARLGSVAVESENGDGG